MHYIFIILLLFLFPQGENTWECREGKIAFLSDAPLELISAESKQLKGMLREEDQSFAFTVPSASFDGFNSPLQKEHFNENYLESKKYPRSSFHGKIIEPLNLDKNGVQQVRAKGILNIHGIEQERIIKVDLDIQNSRITASSKFTVPLTDHNITIPKVVHQKIAEEITVQVNALLLKK